MKSPKLLCPGPVHMTKEILKQMSQPLIWHRSETFAQLYGETIRMLKKIIFTKQNVFTCSASASGLWEASIRNCVNHDEKILCTLGGWFGGIWANVAKNCGRSVDTLEVENGQPITAEMLDKKLAKGKYAAVTLIHCESDSGLVNPVYEISEMMKEKYPDLFVLVDAASSMIGHPLHFDTLGWDVAFASVQKAFGVPPVLTVFGISDRALKKSKKITGRGFYFDFQQIAKFAENNFTPATPAISQILALNYRCRLLLEESIERVWDRHKGMANFVRDWAKERFELFCNEKYASNTITTIKNTQNIDVPGLIKTIEEKHGVRFGNGLGNKLENKTFRVAHMGDITLQDLEQLLGWIDEEIGQ